MKSRKELSARINKDKAKKQAKRNALHTVCDSLEQVVTHKNAIKALRKCNANVGYKKSVQSFNDRAIELIDDMIKTIFAGGVPKVATDRQVIIRERGKARKISPVVINDRLLQHIIADNALEPILSRRLIWQNCANQAGKGTICARKLVNTYLEQAKKLWGDNFFVWTFDFSNFFGSIPHSTCCNKVLLKGFADRRLVNLCMGIIISYQEAQHEKRYKIDKTYSRQQMESDIANLKAYRARGICLGSQISQDMAISVPNDIDHYIKEEAHMPFYVRFADDGMVIWNNREDLIALQKQCEVIARELGLAFNPNKTNISHIKDGFVFLKRRYRVLDNTTIQTLHRTSIARMRRKLRKYRHLVDQGAMTLDDVYLSLQAWESHVKGTRCARSMRSINRLYYSLFGGDTNAILQNRAK